MTAIINGNKFVSIPHLFVPGVGCFFPTKEIAEREITANMADYYGDTYDYKGQTYYRVVARNTWG